MRLALAATLLAVLIAGCASTPPVSPPSDAKVYEDTAEQREAWYAACNWCRENPEKFRASELPGGSRPGYRPRPSNAWLAEQGYTYVRLVTGRGADFVAVAAPEDAP
jgi:hypothetical protein